MAFVHKRVWDAAVVGVGGTSAAVDLGPAFATSAYGNASAATTITMQYSAGDGTFRDGPNQVLAAAADFRIDANVGAPAVRLKSSAAATITADISAKS